MVILIKIRNQVFFGRVIIIKYSFSINSNSMIYDQYLACAYS